MAGPGLIKYPNCSIIGSLWIKFLIATALLLSSRVYVIPKRSQPNNEISITSTISDNVTATAIADEDVPSPICCYNADVNLTETFTDAYFTEMRNRSKNPLQWTGKEYEQWKKISSIIAGSRRCEAEWTQILLQEALAKGEGHYLRVLMDSLLGRNKKFADTIQFVGERPNIPRVLFLGDSVSAGIWMELHNTHHQTANASLVKSPTNCAGFDFYALGMDRWLGDCPWDVIQFNVGLHFHPLSGEEREAVRKRYEQELEWVVHRLRAHSPDAALVFALTTPSPLDSNETSPNSKSCRNYAKFHPTGFVPFLNSVAQGFLPALNVTINDRYGAIHPFLKRLQIPCDVHYRILGYQVLAKQDWGVVSGLLIDHP